MNIRNLPVMLAFAIASVISASSLASPILLDVTLRVVTTGNGLGGDIDLTTLVDPPNIGNEYHALIGVDDSILVVDGIARAGKILSFNAQIGPTQWNPDLPAVSGTSGGNAFVGFRGPCYDPALACTTTQWDVWGMPSEYLGFDVSGGNVVGLWGGVYGMSDFPFIDFQGGQYGSLSAFELLPDSDPGRFTRVATNGFLSVAQVTSVPEPSSALLLLFGAGILCAVTHTRTRRIL